MVSQTLIEELKQQKIWFIYFKTITKNGNTTKSPRSAKNTATGADKAHTDAVHAEYHWADSTISHMLSRIDYLGHLANFKTYRKTYKNKKQMQNDPEHWRIFENHHEAIIDQETFDIVQRIPNTF